MRRQITAMAAVILASALLTACGGSSPSQSAVSGVVAVGAPVVGAQVSLRCADGSQHSATTAAGGSWSVPVPAGLAFPCLVAANGGTPPAALYSLASGAGLVNVTPVTTLIVTRAAGSTPQAWLAANAGSFATAVAQLSANLGQAADIVRQSLAASGYTVPLGDFISTPFQPVGGDAFDDLLEAIGQGAAASGLTLDDLVTRFATTSLVVQVPRRDVLTAAQVAAMPQLNLASASVTDGVATLSTRAGASAIGAYVGGGTGNKAILQLPGLEGMKLSDLQSVAIDLRSRLQVPPTGAASDGPYLALNVMIDLQCDQTPLAASATIADVRARRRLLTFDPFYTWYQPSDTVGNTRQVRTITPASGGWRISSGANVGVEQAVHGASYTLAGFNHTQYPNACVVAGISGDGGMFRNRMADPACATSAGLAGSAPAVCGLAHAGVWLYIGHSGMQQAGAWDIYSVRINERTFTFE